MIENSDFVEIKVSIKDDEQKLSKSFPCYKTVSISHDDPELKRMVDSVIADFKGDKKSFEVAITLKYTW